MVGCWVVVCTITSFEVKLLMSAVTSVSALCALTTHISLISSFSVWQRKYNQGVSCVKVRRSVCVWPAGWSVAELVGGQSVYVQQNMHAELGVMTCDLTGIHSPSLYTPYIHSLTL